MLSNSYILALATAACASIASAQTHVDIMGGLDQPLLLGGGNIAAAVATSHWDFEYSHGWSLRIGNYGFGLNGEEKRDHLVVTVPWTTGFGAGYRFTRRFTVLLDFKAHRFEVKEPGVAHTAYTTFSIGPTVYYKIPLYRGLFIQPNVRYWPTVANTLHSTFVHHAHDWGVFPNMNLGWTF